MTFRGIGSEALDLIASLGGPQAASPVATRSDYFVPLRVELDFTDLVLVTLQDGRAGSREHVVDARHAVCARRRQLVACAVEAGVKNLVVVAAELLDALTRINIPQPGRPVDAPRQTVVSCEIKLAT